jgi:hypothetical protein
MFISVRTVEHHRLNICAKLELNVGGPVKPLPWPTRSNREFRTRQELEVVFALNKNRAGSACGANDAANRCSFSTAGNGADDSSDSRGNACALDRLRGLVSALRASLVVNLDSVAI